MTTKLERKLAAALRAARRQIRRDRHAVFDSYRNLSGPHRGKVTDENGAKWLAEYDKVLVKIDTALALVGGPR